MKDVSTAVSPQFNDTGTDVASVLVFSAAGALDDLRAAYDDAPLNYRVYLITEANIKLTFYHFCGKTTGQYNYVDLNQKLKKNYKNYLSSILNILKKQINLLGIVSFNHAYFAQKELAAAARGRNIRFLVLYKECLRPPGTYSLTEEQFKHGTGPFFGDAIAVHNRETKLLLINGRICHEHNICITGQSRSTPAFKIREQRIKDIQKNDVDSYKTIVIYAINERGGLPYFNKGDGGMVLVDGKLPEGFTWQSISEQTYSVITALAERYTENIFVIKGKSGALYRGLQLLPRRANIVLQSEKVNLELLKKARIVVGFNTTAVLEAAIAGVPSIVPLFLQCNEAIMQEYVLNYGGVAIYPRNHEELFSCIADHIMKPPIVIPKDEEWTRVIEKYLGNSDGKAGQRVRWFLEKHLREVK